MAEGADQTGWWIGAGGVVTALVTAVGAWFTSKRKQDAENAAREDDRADRMSAETIKRYESRVDKLEIQVETLTESHLECQKEHAKCEERCNTLSNQIQSVRADLEQKHRERDALTKRVAQLEAKTA